MKYLLSFLMIQFLSVGMIYSQIDFSAGGSGASPSPIALGETTILETSIAITETTGGGQLGIGCLQVLVSFDESKVAYVGPVTTGPQPFIITGDFNWIYVPGDGIYGSNLGVLMDGDGGSILLEFQSLVSGPPTSVQFSTNLSDVFSCTNSNDGTNDGAFATAVLPVVYKNISIKSESCIGNSLYWSTASEINNSHFEVEASRDGKTFISIGKVKGGGNVAGDYKFIDENKYVNQQSIQYRLKQVDFDGRFSYSDIVYVKYVCEKQIAMALSPNPAKDEIRVEFEGADLEEINAILLDGNGAYVKDVYLSTGTINKVNINNLLPGIYILQAKVDGQQFNQRFIKID